MTLGFSGNALCCETRAVADEDVAVTFSHQFDRSNGNRTVFGAIRRQTRTDGQERVGSTSVIGWWKKLERRREMKRERFTLRRRK